MKNLGKRTLTAFLAVCLFVVPLFSISAVAAAPEEVMPLYNNTVSATSNMSINSNGKMTISYIFTGYPSTTTKAVITTYIEKKTLLFFWSRVDNGQTDKQWVDTITDYRYAGAREYQLSSSGTYRVTITYVIYGTGGSPDEITHQITDSY